MIMGPQISSVGDVFAKQKYHDWDDCRDNHSKNWCKNYLKDHDHDDDNDEEIGHHKVLVKANPQVKTAK